MATATKARDQEHDQDQQDSARELERYRQAAEDALQQLDWCIGYLHGIRKVALSKALARNRAFIRRSLLDRAEEPLPTQQADQE
jgi:hypothetical protein